MDLRHKRENVIRELSDFASYAEDVLNKAVTELGWTKERLHNDTDWTVCPISSNHCMPSSVLSKHLESCSFKHQHPDINQNELLPSSNFCYAKSTSVVPVLINKKLQHEILKNASATNPFEKGIRTDVLDVPPSVDRCITDLTRQERVAIYDYVVYQGKAMNKPSTVSLEDLQMDFESKQEAVPEEKSQLEILAEQRDYKRRRPSYRAKNVHITKKSYTEVMKEVIANQTKFLEDTVKSKVKKEISPSPPRNNEEDWSERSKIEQRSQSRDSEESNSDSERSSRKHREHISHKHKRHKEHRSRHKSSKSRK